MTPQLWPPQAREEELRETLVPIGLGGRSLITETSRIVSAHKQRSRLPLYLKTSTARSNAGVDEPKLLVGSELQLEIQALRNRELEVG